MSRTVVLMLIFSAAMISANAQVDSAGFQKKYALADSLSNISLQQWVKDSLTILSWSDSIRYKVNTKFLSDSLGIQHKIDSLQNLQLPTGKYVQKLDSISNKKNTLLSEVSSKQNDLESKTRGRLQEWQGKVRSKLGLDSLQHHTGMKIPGMDLPDVQNKIPGLNEPSIPTLNGAELPELPALSTGDFQNLELSPDLSDINQSLPFGDLDGLKDIQEKLGSAGDALAQATSFTKDPDKAIDAAVNNIDQLGGVQEQLGAVDEIQQNEFLEKAKQLEDPEAMKEAAQQEVMKEAVNHFAGKEEQLKQAMDKVAKYKQKYSSVNSLSEIPKKRPNEMRGKPLIERLLPGIGLQIQRKNDLLIDFNPYLGYRLTGRLTAGAGWNQRVAFIKWNEFNAQGSIYGPRLYSEFRVWKGFSPRLEFEYMNTIVPPGFHNAPLDEGVREWVFSSMVGLKKEYQFIKSVRGTAMVMFNLFNPHHKSPYVDVVNMRFGFEFPMKKRLKKSDHSSTTAD